MCQRCLPNPQDGQCAPNPKDCCKSPCRKRRHVQSVPRLLCQNVVQRVSRSRRLCIAHRMHQNTCRYSMRKRFGRHIVAVANIPQRHIRMGRGMMRSSLAQNCWLQKKRRVLGDTIKMTRPPTMSRREAANDVKAGGRQPCQGGRPPFPIATSTVRRTL